MAFRLEPTVATDNEVRQVARARLDDALHRLDGVEEATSEDIASAVHEVRKRCKEVRGLARLVRPHLGSEFGRCNDLVRSAAAELSSFRDAHALLATVDGLSAEIDGAANMRLEAVREHQAELAEQATARVRRGDPRIKRARGRLTKARARVDRWELPSGFEALSGGLEATYRRGRRDMERAARHPGDESVHAWRKAVKNLWYQLRLIQGSAPSMVGPMVALLDELSELLGGDHDLAVLVAQLEDEPAEYGGKKTVKRTVKLARSRQGEQRTDGLRLGRSVYAETPTAFTARMQSYWDNARDFGPEPSLHTVAPQ